MLTSRNRRCRAGPLRLVAVLAVLAVSATALAPTAVSAADTDVPSVGEQSAALHKFK